MLPSRSIKSLYPLALAEGEGVGTAYEYYAKRLLLRGFLKRIPRPRRILIAGLPEKYGSSLDFLLLAEELEAEVVVADARPEALEKGQRSVAAARQHQFLHHITPHFIHISDPVQLPELDGPFDLALCCEVLQALPAAARPAYWQRLSQLAPAIALFTPNAGNPAHSTHSGLRTISLDELQTLVQNTPATQVGLADLPPFPSGMTRSEAQREQASTGLVESLAMWGLNYYAQLEKFVPTRLRRHYAHMVYVLARPRTHT